MRQIILTIVLFLALVLPCQSQMLQSVVTGKTTVSAHTDYTADVNCMGAWFMNGGFSAGTDNETDRSGESGTLIETGGDIPNSSTTPTSFSGTSRDFEAGESEYLTHANNLSTDITGSALTIVAQIKSENITNGTYQGVVGKYDTNSQKQYVLVLYGNNTDSYVVRAYLSADGSATTVAETDQGYASGTYRCIGVVYNGSAIQIYVDGTTKGSPSAFSSNLHAGSSTFNLGMYLSSGSAANYFDGLMDEVAVFDRALSADEMLEICSYGIDGSNGGND